MKFYATPGMPRYHRNDMCSINPPQNFPHVEVTVNEIVDRDLKPCGLCRPTPVNRG